MKRLTFIELLEEIYMQIAVYEDEFVLDSVDFGKLVFKVNFKNHDPESTTVNIVKWEAAPASRFNILNKDTNAAYYIEIFNVNDETLAELRAIEVIYRLLFIKLLGVEINSEVVDAVTLIYKKWIDNEPLTVNQLYDTFINHNFNVFMKHNQTVQWLVRKHVENKMEKANMVIDNSLKLFNLANSTRIWKEVIKENYEYHSRLIGLVLQNAEGINLSEDVIATKKVVNTILEL